MIKHIKFHAHPGLITDIKSYFMSYTMPQSYDFWVSVPYHRAKINERGFNLIHGLFGEWLSQSHISYYPLLLRHNNTKPLAGLSTVERKKVLSNVFSFQLSPMRITGKRILIVDDIYTTGTTVTQIQQLLACYEPKKVDILCLCKTPININRSQ